MNHKLNVKLNVKQKDVLNLQLNLSMKMYSLTPAGNIQANSSSGHSKWSVWICHFPLSDMHSILSNNSSNQELREEIVLRQIKQSMEQDQSLNIALALRGHSLKGPFLLRGPIHRTMFSTGTNSLYLHFFKI